MHVECPFVTSKIFPQQHFLLQSIVYFYISLLRAMSGETCYLTFGGCEIVVL